MIARAVSSSIRQGIKIRACFVILNYLLGALGLYSLTLSEIFPDLVNAMFLLGLALCCYLELNKAIPITPPVRFSISKAGLVVVPLLYLVFHLPLLELVVGFLLIVFFSRFIFKTELNDYLYGYLIAIVCLLLGAIYIRDLIFGFIFLSFYLILCWSLMFYNLMVERGGSHCPPSEFNQIGENETVVRSLFGLSAGLVTASLLLTILIFAFFPRLGLGFLMIRSQSSPISGFSETVKLGDVGRIKLNPEVVMRVEYQKDDKSYRPQSRVLWRGVVLDHYDGTTWTSTIDADWQFANLLGNGVKLFKRGPDPDTIRQDVYMETFDSDIVFTQGVPIFLNGNFRHISLDRNFVLRTVDNQTGPKKISFISEMADREVSFNLIAPGSEEDGFIDKFLQLPESLNPKVEQLASDLVRSTESIEEKAGKILGHFRVGFGYSLDMGKEINKNSLDDFLFKNKSGHCEYFASAMVILLRSAGIYARLVNGFVGSEWNEMGNYMIIRQSHAHSWVEALVPGKGWVVYDPTPTDPAGAINQMDNPLTRALDLLRLNWQRYVVRYSFKDQVRLIAWFGNSGRDVFDKFKSLKKTDWKQVNHYLQDNILLLGLLAGLIYLFKYRAWAFSFRPRPPFPVVLYASMLKKLGKYGIHKQANWTHREFIKQLSSLSAEKHEIVERLTDYYEHSRFGNLVVTKEEKNTMLKYLRQL